MSPGWLENQRGEPKGRTKGAALRGDRFKSPLRAAPVRGREMFQRCPPPEHFNAAEINKELPLSQLGG